MGEKMDAMFADFVARCAMPDVTDDDLKEVKLAFCAGIVATLNAIMETDDPAQLACDLSDEGEALSEQLKRGVQ